MQDLVATPVVTDLTDPKKIVSTDDYMPMAINTLEDYEKVLSVSWIAQEKSPEELTWVLLSWPWRPILIMTDRELGSHACCHSRRCIPFAASTSGIW